MTIDSLEIKNSWILRIENISKAYLDEGTVPHPVLKDISLELEKNTITAILGPSGCGKTTLIHIIAGLINSDEGSIKFCDPRIESEIGIMLQDSVLLPWRRLKENIQLERKIRRKKIDHVLFRDLIQVTNLYSSLQLYPFQMSGGMKRKAALIRCLLFEPSLLLLDEPFSSIDPVARQHLQDYLSKWVRLKLRTIIMVTHDIEDAIKWASRVVVLRGNPANIREDISIPQFAPNIQSESKITSYSSFGDRLIRAFLQPDENKPQK